MTLFPLIQVFLRYYCYFLIFFINMLIILEKESKVIAHYLREIVDNGSKKFE